MKQFRWFLLISLLGLLLAEGAAPNQSPPNILFILTDDLGINDLGCYGRSEHATPNLDRLAAQGLRFTSAYCAQPICSPSRAAILTGKAPARLHLTTFLPGRPDCAAQRLLHPQMEQQLPLAETTLAEHLRKAGYATAGFGKWHLGGKGFQPTDQGFEVFHPGQANTSPSATEGGKGEYGLTRRAITFLETNRSRPFFLFLSHNSPHIPYTARTNLIARHARAFEPVYAALLETLDDSVGLLLRRLEELNLATNTLVIFTSDNGGLHVPELQHRTITHNAPFRAGKGFLYEGGLRVPLLVCWPGWIAPGRVEATPVINTDWLPTLLELAGVKIPEGLDGRSLAGLLRGPKPGPDRSLFWHFPHYTNQGSRPGGAVREGDWKLIEHYESGRLELYNLASDPGEAHDRASREPVRAAALQARLAAWRLAVGAQTNRPNPNFEATLGRRLYEEVDVTRFNASQAGPALQERVLEWRRLMDEVVAGPGRR